MHVQPPSPQELKAELFKALASPMRIRILEMLRAGGSLTVGELQQRLGVTTSNVSQHLALMRRLGMLRVRGDGTSRWYSVADARVFDLLDAAHALLERNAVDQAEAVRSRR